MRTAVMEAAYRSGQGSTTSMLSVWQRTETLAARVQEKKILQVQVQQELEAITGLVASVANAEPKTAIAPMTKVRLLNRALKAKEVNVQ